MPHYADGSHCRMVPGSEGCPFIAVGWLDPEASFPTGKVTDRFFRKLCSLLSARWSLPYAGAGQHQCGLCQFGMSTTRHEEYEFQSCSGSELFIPNGVVTFVTPVNIAHCISAHHYLPPLEFLAAVEACPPPGSGAFLKLFLDSGGREWVRAWERSEGGAKSHEPGDRDMDEMFYQYSAAGFPELGTRLSLSPGEGLPS